jgi:hypothetical protein
MHYLEKRRNAMKVSTIATMLGTLAMLVATAGCSIAPQSVASNYEAGFHAGTRVDEALANTLADRGDVQVTNSPKGWYR